MFKGFSLSIKLTIAFLLTASLVAGVSIYQIKSVNDFNRSSIHEISLDADRLGELETMRVKVMDVERQAIDFYNHHLAGDPTNAESSQAALQKLGQEIDEIEKTYQGLNSGNANVSQETVTSILDGNDQMIQAAIDFVGAIGNVPAAQAAKMADDLVDRQKMLNDKIAQAIAGTSKLIDTEEASIVTKMAEISRTNMMLAGLAVSVAVIIGLLVAELLSRSIAKIQTGAERIANGDFSRPIAVGSHDEIGRLAESFNMMAVRLRDSYARLAFERQRDETLLESINDGLIAIDTEGKIVLVNSRAVDMLELGDRETLPGRSLDEVLRLWGQDDKPLPADYRLARKAYEASGAVSEALNYHRSDGKKIAVLIGMSPVISDGKVAGVIMVVRDVTREREVDRMKTEFISLASHQLRTPLSAIKWFSEMLLSGDAGKLTPDQTEFAKNVADSTERMIDLVNSLLNISRIESGRIMVDPKPTDLSELVNGIVNDLKAKIEERQQTLVVSVHKELPKINLDPRLVGQVYLNLLTNAIKYTPKGGEVSVIVSRKDNDLVSQVSDNGYGIPKSEQVKMFQKFFRATNVSKVETDGTGLGLYLIKAIVESSGGKIWFESEEGKGTTFWFSLPMSGMKPKQGEVTLDA